MQMKTIVRSGLLFLVLVFQMACGGGSGSSENAQSNNVPTYLSTEINPVAEFELLFIGNSHSGSNGLPQLVAALVEQGSEKQANGFRQADSAFLDERSFQGDTFIAIQSRPWTHVILQAQKYSTSGQYHYPTDAAEEWIRIVKAANAKPVLFPEHPQINNPAEGSRVHELHLGIASREAACVSPVGLAWNLALARYPTLSLHLDGNHANLVGSLLTAYVFYQVITGLPANQLPFSADINVDESTQTILKEIANETVLLHPPCTLLPE